MTPRTFLPDLTRSARRRADEAARNHATWRAAVTDAPAPLDFRGALVGDGLAVIAEAKQQSPSKGRLAGDDYDAGLLAREYERAGASAMSVLTEPDFFLGRLSHLAAARERSGLPLLRKDFLLEPAQVAEARAFGADAVLAIVRILRDEELASLIEAARQYGIAVLVEVHNAAELERALAAGAELIGVNNRDLDTFETRLERCLDLASQIPDGVTTVAESGIRTPDDIRAVRAAGYQAALIGEQFMVSGTGLMEAASQWLRR